MVNILNPEVLPGTGRGAPRKPTRESQIEQYLAKRVKALGGEVRKAVWIGRKGAPDRLVMLPERPGPRVDTGAGGGFFLRNRAPATIWVELKAPGKAATFPSNAHERAQHREHERMREMGQRVEVVDSYAGVDEVLK